MELAFNEMSVMPLSANPYAANEKMKLFGKAVVAAQKLGVRNIRSAKLTDEILLAPDYTLKHWFHDKRMPRDDRPTNLLSVFISPFINEENTEHVKKYFTADDYYFEDAAAGITRQDCAGLVTAYVCDSGCISLTSAHVWKQRKLNLQIVTQTGTEAKPILNTWSEECFAADEVKDLIERSVTTKLVETTIPVSAKEAKITAHHGQAELEAFWSKIKHCKYVEGMETNEFGKSRNFIRSTSKDGVIEIVLLDTEKDYGVRVYTTGRNLRETKEIADYIQDHYE